MIRPRRTSGLWFAMMVAAPGLAAAAPKCTTEFVRSVGVATHLDSRSSQYGDLAKVVEALNYLGVYRIRDVAPRSSAGLATFKALIAALDQVRLTLIVMDDPNRALPMIHALASHVAIVEGPNEVDRTPVRFQGLTGVDAVMANQRAIYDAVKADPALNNPKKHTPVLNFSLARADYTPYGDMSASADLANVHAYATRGVPPFWMVQPTVRKAASFLDRPVVITEANYPTLTQPDGNGVSEPVQARWVLNTQFDSFRNDVVATYIYQLEDGVADPGGHTFESHFGLFRFDHTPKPAATALRTLLRLLKDDRPCPADAAPAPFYKASLPHGGFDLLLARPDGSFVLVLWAEPVIWDPVHNADIPARPVAATVTFGTDRHDARVYDPLTGLDPIADHPDADQVVVTLTDHPILIAFR